MPVYDGGGGGWRRREITTAYTIVVEWTKRIGENLLFIRAYKYIYMFSKKVDLYSSLSG